MHWFFCLLLALMSTLSASSTKVYPIAIIGAGAGGTMAVKRAVLNNREVLLFTGHKKEMKRSRGYWVRKVENVPGLDKYTRTLVQLKKEVLEELQHGPLKRNLTVVNDSVLSITKQGALFSLVDKTGKSYLARYVIVATGMMDEQPHIQGSIRHILPYANKQTVAYCVLCDGHKSHKKDTVVIGYSEDAAKACLVLEDRYKPTKLTLLTNGKKASFSPETRGQLLAKKIQIDETPIKKILGKSKGILSGFELESSKKVQAEIGFVMLGVRPNNRLALDLGAAVDEKGLVITDVNGESTVPNLFVIGDLRSGSIKQIYTAWQHAIDALQLIDLRIRSESVLQ